jgi:hypothetical protein
MKKCIICEGLLSEDQFRFKNDICRVCYKKLQSIDSSYTGGPKSIIYSYISLLAAIRNTAEIDGEIDSWKEYWMSEPWITIWKVIDDSTNSSYSWIKHKSSILRSYKNVKH